MTTPEGFDLRYTSPEDEPFLRKWLLAGMLGSLPMGNHKEIDEMVPNWIGFSKWHCSLTGTLEGVPCALGTLFLMPYRKVAHHCLFYLIVEEKWQRQGIGSSLLKNLKHLAKEYFRLEMMHGDVYGEDQASLRLLLKCGFQQIAVQEKFVMEEGRYQKRYLMNCYL